MEVLFIIHQLVGCFKKLQDVKKTFHAIEKLLVI
jgi:hypothetical protein